MKNICLAMMILLIVGAGGACTFNVPWEVMDDYDGVRVVMRVVPDDADVLLNGRWIGAAYEFASAGTALRLASRQNELVLKKKGYREKQIDLRAYSSRTITVKAELESEGAPAAPAEPAAPAAGGDEAYEAKSEPLPPLPAEPPAPVAKGDVTEITMTVSPEETAVYIDNRFWGVSGGKAMSLRLSPGKYAFAAFKPGFRSYSQEIIVPKREKFSLAITLEK